MRYAKSQAERSKDPSTKTGAVVVDGIEIISTGFNRFPNGVKETEPRYADRALKYRMIVHSETNAIINADRHLLGTTIYIWPFMCCAPCAGMIIQSGIKRVVAPYNDNPRWQEDFAIATTMFKEAGVTLDLLTKEEIEF